jgi:hypothetical protein
VLGVRLPADTVRTVGQHGRRDCDAFDRRGLPGAAAGKQQGLLFQGERLENVRDAGLSTHTDSLKSYVAAGAAVWAGR